VQDDLLELQKVTEEIYSCLQDKLVVLVNGTERRSASYHSATEPTGGRPRFIVTRGQLQRLLALSFSKTKISELLGISRTTLWRRMRDLDVDRLHTTLSDDDLNDIVSTYRKNHPFTGKFIHND
jgi:transcriptional regulator of acetoin/glycerol metabolism